MGERKDVAFGCVLFVGRRTAGGVETGQDWTIRVRQTNINSKTTIYLTKFTSFWRTEHHRKQKDIQTMRQITVSLEWSAGMEGFNCPINQDIMFYQKQFGVDHAFNHGQLSN